MTTQTTEGLAPRDGIPPSGGSTQSSPIATASAGEPLRRIVRVRNPLGLHQRAADRFARAAKRFACAVTLFNGDLKANGKDLWDLIMLSVFPDSDVILEVDGSDASAALEILAEILGAPNGEDYTI
ncbi:MAG TPA: HPr family phosphocarrier protein [Gemmata sp.]|nr:HPr family phosphocarrier protein [Gemmata sp.]